MIPNQLAPTAAVSLNSEEVAALLSQKRYDEISEKLLSVLEHFRVHTYITVSPEEQYFIDQFVKVFLFVLSEPYFVISDRYVLRYLSFNHVISNVVAISTWKTTDPWVEILARQQNNLVRLMTIYSARNRFKLDRKVIFDANPAIASAWFAFYACTYYSGLVSQTGWENLREHFSFTDPRLRINQQIQETYFGSTYAGGERDRIMKPIVNLSAREGQAAIQISRRQPDRRKIAVCSAFWVPSTSVFRNYSAYVRSLKPDYHLTFLQISGNPPPEEGVWDQVIRLSNPTGGLNVGALQNNNFQMVYFPDIGMSDASIMLANLRLAPIQICSPGHSVSTYGALVDYFISGADVERPENPEGNYSERLVLLPGMGVVHNRPAYEVRGLKKQNEVLLINVPAWCQKLNHPYVQALKKIRAAAKTRFKLRVFTGNSLLRSNDYVPFYREFIAQLGAEDTEIVPPLAYSDYMANMERGDLTFDAYHFGGCNTVSDSLFVRVPMLCWEGDKWYNRIGPEMLRRAGLPELFVTNEEQYIERALQLIDEEEYRESVRQKVSQVNLDTAIYSTEHAPFFKKAVDYVIENHEQLQKDGTRDPIRIPRA
jgi:hypothetical protein